VQFGVNYLDSRRYPESAIIDTDEPEDKNALYIYVYKADATFSKQLLEQVGINSIISIETKDAGENVNGALKYMTKCFPLYLPTSELTKIPRLIKAMVIFYKV
jgi:hypothetical protein